MKYAYLCINILTILIPLARSFENKLQFFRKWPYYFPATLITGLFFLVWDYYKTSYGVWSFNPQYIVGIKVAGLPLEEILFFITVPYACTFIYESLGYYLKEKKGISRLGVILLAASPVFFVLSFFAWGRAYTWSVLIISGLWMPVAFYLLGKQAGLFVLAYLVSILPMLVVNGILTALPIVIYNNTENLGIRLGTIPVEDFLYCLILLAMNIGLYEWFHRRQAAKAANYNLAETKKALT